MAKFSLVECDIDGEGRRWRLMVDANEFLTLADEDFTVARTEVIENGDRIVGPFTAEQLYEAVRSSRIAGPHFAAQPDAVQARK